jgi:hypothetical protein
MSNDKTLTKAERMQALEANIPQGTKDAMVIRANNKRNAIIEKMQLQLENDPHDVDIVLATDADTEFARKTIKELITGSSESLDNLKTFAGDLESPRGYEVLATMMNTIGNLSKDLIEIQKGRKDVRKSRVKKETITTIPGANQPVNVFVGTTQELQNRIKEAESAVTDV